MQRQLAWLVYDGTEHRWSRAYSTTLLALLVVSQAQHSEVETSFALSPESLNHCSDNEHVRVIVIVVLMIVVVVVVVVVLLVAWSLVARIRVR